MIALCQARAGMLHVYTCCLFVFSLSALPFNLSWETFWNTHLRNCICWNKKNYHTCLNAQSKIIADDFQSYIGQNMRENVTQTKQKSNYLVTCCTSMFRKLPLFFSPPPPPPFSWEIHTHLILSLFLFSFPQWFSLSHTWLTGVKNMSGSHT